MARFCFSQIVKMKKEHIPRCGNQTLVGTGTPHSHKILTSSQVRKGKCLNVFLKIHTGSEQSQIPRPSECKANTLSLDQQVP